MMSGRYFGPKPMIETRRRKIKEEEEETMNAE
jgi:hypothetical protein